MIRLALTTSRDQKAHGTKTYFLLLHCGALKMTSIVLNTITLKKNSLKDTGNVRS